MSKNHHYPLSPDSMQTGYGSLTMSLDVCSVWRMAEELKCDSMNGVCGKNLEVCDFYKL